MKSKILGFLVLATVVAAQGAFGQLTGPRDTPMRAGETVALTAGGTIYAGSMVAVTGTLAVAASDAAGRKVVGRAENSATAGQVVNVRRGTFQWANGGSFTAAHIGNLAYVDDDATVTTAASATHDIIAGVIIDVDAGGVWVDTYHLSSQGAASVTTLNASGAAALGSTLAVTGNTTVGGTLGVTGASTLASTLAVTGNITGTADVKGATLSIGDGSLIRDGDALLWVEGGVTNTVVADVTD